MSTLYRAQILLEPEQHRTLTEIAKREGKSVSELVREIVREHLVKQDKRAKLQREMEALEALAQIRKQVEAKHGIYRGDLVAEAREEREHDIERVWRDGL